MQGSEGEGAEKHTNWADRKAWNLYYKLFLKNKADNRVAVYSICMELSAQIVGNWNDSGNWSLPPPPHHTRAQEITPTFSA